MKNQFEEEQSKDFSFTNKYKSLNLGLQVGVGVGIGRIENVTDARQAIYILNNLSNKGVLKRQLSNEEVFNFAQLISTVKNKRHFDHRLHEIREITAVDSFFVAKNLLDKNGASYFTTLYDYWRYGDLHVRKSGMEFETRIAPMIHKSFSDEEIIGYNKKHDKYNSLSKQLGWINRFSYQNPKNLYWQNSAVINVVAILGDEESDYGDSESTKDFYGADIIGKYGWSYFPNTRTEFTATLS